MVERLRRCVKENDAVEIDENEDEGGMKTNTKMRGPVGKEFCHFISVNNVVGFSCLSIKHWLVHCAIKAQQFSGAYKQSLGFIM